MEDVTMKRNNPYIKYFIAYGLFCLGSSLIHGAYNNFFPILLQTGNPNFAKGAGELGFGLNAFPTSIIMSIDNVFAVTLALIIGVWGDRTPRRRGYSVIFGIIGALAFSLLPLVILTNKTAASGDTMALMPQLILTIFLVIVFVFMHSGGSQLRLGYSYNIMPKDNQSMMFAVAMVFEGVGFLAFTALGSVLYAKSRVFPFLLGGGMTIVFLILFWFLSPPETKKNQQLAKEAASGSRRSFNPFRQIADTYTLIPANARFAILMTLIAYCLSNIGVYALETFASSYMLDVLNIPPNRSIIVIGVYYVGYLIAAIPTGAIARRVSRKLLILIGVIAMGVGALLTLLFGKSIPTLAVFCLIMGLGQSIVNVVSVPYIMSHAPEDGTHTGTLNSSVSTLRLLVSIVSVPLVGALIDLSGSYNSIFIIMIVACVLALIPVFLLIRRVNDEPLPQQRT